MATTLEQIGTGRRRGLVMVLSSPSGAGKTTLSRSLIETDQQLSLSISATTRGRRPSEADGVHYHFIKDNRSFERMRDDGDLLEWAEVHGNYYGTPKATVLAEIEKGKDVLFDIDWQGTQQAREALGEDLVSVFIVPPSAQELLNRLSRRAEDSDAVIQKRMANAQEEVAHYGEYDYVIVNRDLEASLKSLRSILMTERLKRQRQTDLDTFISDLCSDLAGYSERSES